jgi:hypothetical protein
MSENRNHHNQSVKPEIHLQTNIVTEILSALILFDGARNKKTIFFFCVVPVICKYEPFPSSDVGCQSSKFAKEDPQLKGLESSPFA